jgi:hypothetical protein
LTARADKAEPAYHAFKWLTQKAQPEWVQLSAIDLFKLMRAKGEWRTLRAMIAQDADLQDWMKHYQGMMGVNGAAPALGMVVQDVRLLRATP